MPVTRREPSRVRHDICHSMVRSSGLVGQKSVEVARANQWQTPREHQKPLFAPGIHHGSPFILCHTCIKKLAYAWYGFCPFALVCHIGFGSPPGFPVVLPCQAWVPLWVLCCAGVPARFSLLRAGSTTSWTSSYGLAQLLCFAVVTDLGCRPLGSNCPR